MKDVHCISERHSKANKSRSRGSREFIMQLHDSGSNPFQINEDTTSFVSALHEIAAETVQDSAEMLL